MPEDPLTNGVSRGRLATRRPWRSARACAIWPPAALADTGCGGSARAGSAGATTCGSSTVSGVSNAAMRSVSRRPPRQGLCQCLSSPVISHPVTRRSSGFALNSPPAQGNPAAHPKLFAGSTRSPMVRWSPRPATFGARPCNGYTPTFRPGNPRVASLNRSVARKSVRVTLIEGWPSPLQWGGWPSPGLLV
jgi:hypothetical protein